MLRSITPEHILYGIYALFAGIINWFIPVDKSQLHVSVICAKTDNAIMTIDGRCSLLLSNDDVMRVARRFVLDNVRIAFVHDSIKCTIAALVVLMAYSTARFLWAKAKRCCCYVMLFFMTLTTIFTTMIVMHVQPVQFVG